jgi:hypothetical protein
MVPQLACIVLKSLYWFPSKTSTNFIQILLWKELFSTSHARIPLFLTDIGYLIEVISTYFVECVAIVGTPCIPLLIIVKKCDTNPP